MKVYVVCDLEGTAGVVDHRQQCWPDGKYYEQARRLATLELNALVEGILGGGATEVVAWDGHGNFPGGLDVELLHPACKLVMMAGDGGPEGLDASFDALYFCGLHGMAGAERGVLRHSFWPGVVESSVNGRPYGEIAASLDIAGRLGVPAVFLSGDRAAAEEVKALVPGIETVVVKEGLRVLPAPPEVGVEPAVTLSLAPEQARAAIREGARRALALVGKLAPFSFATPCNLCTRYLVPELAERAMGAYPGALRVDEVTVVVEGSETFFALI